MSRQHTDQLGVVLLGHARSNGMLKACPSNRLPKSGASAMVRRRADRGDRTSGSTLPRLGGRKSRPAAATDKKRNHCETQRDSFQAVEFEDVCAPSAGQAKLHLSGIRVASLAESTRGHALIRHQFFYTLPSRLLDLLESELGGSRFEAELWKVERERSEQSGDHTWTIGFRDDVPISFGYLREHRLDHAAIEFFRKNGHDDPSEVVRAAQERLSAANRNVRAYLGWLMTNSTFLEEHSRLWTLITPLVSRDGMPQPIPGGARPTMQVMGFSEGSDESEVVALGELQKFCARWRLFELRGPLLPMPLAIQFPTANPMFAAQLAKASGFGTVSLPDTMPLPSEADLRDMLATSISNGSAEHLAPWQAVVRAGNAARKTLPRYARLFELQHYVRLLMSRHTQAFHRRAFQLHLALAAYLEVGDDAIKRDLAWIAAKLGRNWWARFPVPTL